MVFLILALVWVVVLVPQHLRNRADARPTDSIRAFRRQLAILGRTGPAGSGSTLSLVPPAARRRSRATARRRRRAVLGGLLLAATLTLILSLTLGSPLAVALHLVLDALCLGYVALLVHHRRQADRRSGNVRYLPASPADPADPGVLLTSAAT